MSIPKIFHLVWFQIGKGPVSPPEKYKSMVETWSVYHPDWKIMWWNEQKVKKLLEEDYPEYYNMFSNYKKTIFKIDACRYFILHKYGGFYCDCDISCHNNIEKLRDHTVVLSVDKYTKAINNNHFMGSVPSSDFFLQCIKNLPLASRIQIEEDSYICTFSVAGPFFLTTQKTIFPEKNDVYVMTLEEERNYFIHHETHSWNMVRSIGGDLARAGIATSLLLAAGLFIKNITKK